MYSPIFYIKSNIKKNKPYISNASILTYSSLLRTMYMTQHDNDSNISTEWFKNPKNIITALKKLEVNQKGKRFYLAALYALLGYVDKEILDMNKTNEKPLSDTEEKKPISEEQLKMIIENILISLNQK